MPKLNRYKIRLESRECVLCRTSHSSCTPETVRGIPKRIERPSKTQLISRFHPADADLSSNDYHIETAFKTVCVTRKKILVNECVKPAFNLTLFCWNIFRHVRMLHRTSVDLTLSKSTRTNPTHRLNLFLYVLAVYMFFHTIFQTYKINLARDSRACNRNCWTNYARNSLETIKFTSCVRRIHNERVRRTESSSFSVVREIMKQLSSWRIRNFRAKTRGFT